MTFWNDIDQAGGVVYEVGGGVRDQFLGRPIKDKDLVITGLAWERLLSVLRRHGTANLVGRSFGVVKFNSQGQEDVTYDIALPRKEVSTGAGHRDFDVDFDPAIPIETDLSRRDFTINAMAIRLKDGVLIDPFGGREDLAAKRLQMVFDRAFEEDPLRMLRAVQFAARLEFVIEPETLARMKAHAGLIATVSGERIVTELAKLMTARRPSAGFILMRDTGLLLHLFPELHENVGVEQGNKAHGDDVFMHTMKVLDASRRDTAIDLAGDAELMWSALFHDVGKARTKRYSPEKQRLTFYGHQLLSRRMALKRMRALKVETIGIDPQRVAALVEHHMFQTKANFSDRAVRRFTAKVGPDLILKLVDLRLADNRGGKYPEGIKGVLRLKKRIRQELEKMPVFGPKDLAINGHDLMNLGIPEGPKLGTILRVLVARVVDQPELNEREALLKIVAAIQDDPEAALRRMAESAAGDEEILERDAP